MADWAILRSHANEVFGMIRDAGLNPSEFQWEDRRSRFQENGTVSVLVHTPSAYYFKFDCREQAHWAEFSPGKDRAIETQYPGTWMGQRRYAQTWVETLAREINEPDLWSSITSESALVTAAGRTEDREAFSVSEQTKIIASLDEIRQYCLQTMTLSQEQERIVISRLDYLAGAAERMSKKDWLMLVTGVLTNIIVAAAFTPSVARELFRLAGQVLQWVLGERFILP